MAPWSQIAKPFSCYFVFNCLKTLCGAGFVGYGIALAVSDDGDDSVVKGKEKKSDGDEMLLFRKYVKVATTVGFGLFLSLPSLFSQVIWESLIPGITATDIAYDVGAENVKAVLPKWDAIIKKPAILSGTKDVVDGVRKEWSKID